MQQQQIVLVDFGDNEGVRDLGVAGVVALVEGYQFFADLLHCRHVVLDVGEAGNGLLLVTEEYVEASVGGLSPQRLVDPFLSVEVLLESQQSALMSGVLADLDQAGPVMRRELLFAVVALHILLHELHHFGLLHFRRLVDLSYELDLDAHALAVGLRPNELGILDL
jgi:hypothetical protein